MADNTTTQINAIGFAPEVAKYAESNLGAAEKAVAVPYQSYADWAKTRGLSGDQVQAFTDLQNKSFAESKNLGYDPYSMSSAQGLQGLSQQAGNLNYSPTQFGNQYQSPSAYQTGNFGYQQAYAPNLQDYQMSAAQMGPAQQVGTQSITQPGSIDAYMNPYMQNVVEMQKREALRQSGAQAAQQQAQAASAGAFGGGRDAIMRAERERNLGTQLSDIQGVGSQNAFQNAQQQFNAEQQARLQAQMANQQAGLTVGGQNLNAQQQANAQNLAARLGIQQLGAGQSLQAQLANQQAGMTAQQQLEQSRQYGYGQNMRSAELGAQYGLAGQQEAERSRQFGANYGLQGIQAGLQGYGALGSQGQNLYGQNLGNIQLRNAMGTQQQQQGQNMIDAAQRNYADEQNYTKKNIGFMADIINRQPVSTLGSTITSPPPSLISQGLGLAATYYGAQKPSGKAGGGAIRSGAGLVDLALSGM